MNIILDLELWKNQRRIQDFQDFFLINEGEYSIFVK
jgi:hypothetical protein